jgi:hypothetical protein
MRTRHLQDLRAVQQAAEAHTGGFIGQVIGDYVRHSYFLRRK